VFCVSNKAENQQMFVATVWRIHLANSHKNLSMNFANETTSERFTDLDNVNLVNVVWFKGDANFC
jgi:hypothetical protein